jgi:peptide-methionine (S)-S-oxide reductase
MTVTTERAVLAGGCFWGVQDLLRRYPSVISTRVGYTGGEVPNATYRNHGNHAEAIVITFDPKTISYRKLLEFVFQIHDPSTLNRQGNDRGASYRSAIFYTSDDQKRIAHTIADVDASGLWPGKVVTEVAAAGRLWGPNPSIKIIWRNIRTATPVTSFGRIGHCRTARRKLNRARAEFRPRDKTLRSAGTPRSR